MRTASGRESLAGARTAIVGLGKSGIAAARLCRAAGASVVAVDGKAREALSPEALELEHMGVEVRGGGLGQLDYTQFDWVVVSPGVPNFPELRVAERAGVRVIGEIELASWFFPDVPVLAITGSNGKSTTVTLVGELLAAAGRKPFVGGNLGDPPCAFVSTDGAPFPYDVIVLEISSFQAERVPTFHADAVALLNVSPNHLDRYDDFDAYVRAKGNLFVAQRLSDRAIVPADDPRCRDEATRGGGRVLTFGRQGDYRFDATSIRDDVRGLTYDRANVRLAGDHNALNICAALGVVGALELPHEAVSRALASFGGLEHRIALVATRGGVTFYDDSKGTNVGAAVAAIRGLSESRVVLIAGGRDKLGSYTPLVDAMVERGRAAILIGEAAGAIERALNGAVPSQRADSMQHAVELAAAAARPGDAVLLSPACSSFDMFRDYKHRGDAFVEAVRGLAS
jgi:UDP-N-acetylmuramoylalanine--D-glutamate ligase